MLARRTNTLVAVLAPVLSACQPPLAVLTDADRNAIRVTNDRFVKAALAADWAALASTYTEDGIVLPPNGPEVRGRAAIQKFYAGPKVTVLKVNLVEIDGQGDLAYTRGTYDIEVMPPGARAPTKDTGKFVDVWRKQPDGSWLDTRDIWNSDRPSAR